MGDLDFDHLATRVREWIAADPDPSTRAEAARLLERSAAGDACARDRLRDAFAGRLVFGTAGLRAELGPGPRRMNRVVVRQSTAGLARFLLDRERARRNERGRSAVASDDEDPPSVVVGFDGRVNSERFARDAAEVLAGAGLRAILIGGPVPTPVTAFAVRHLDTAAGVMITASHNPPRENGYKVYLGGEDGGSQIVSPDDHEIARRIEEAAALPLSALPTATDYAVVGEELVDAYLEAVAEVLGGRMAHAAPTPPNHGQESLGDAEAAPLTVVYTALHGVGSALTRRLLRRLELPDVRPVPSQDVPDGTFPTVEYPNPEEPGALDLAYREARACGADLVIAHDPDADRLAVAAPDPNSAHGYRRLTGNELGLLLGWRAAEHERSAAEREGRPPRGVLVNTIVSSPSLRAVAAAYDLEHVETLAGAKWFSRVPDLIFGFEESLGYLMLPQLVRDKDGISAAMEIVAMARAAHAAGRTLWQLLDDASERFGHFASAQIVLRRLRAADVETLSGWIRAHPPSRFGEARVLRTRDWRREPTGPVPADVLAFELETGSRVMIRPSGTEPKLKVYLDAFCDAGSAAERRAAATAELARLEIAVREYLGEAET